MRRPVSPAQDGRRHDTDRVRTGGEIPAVLIAARLVRIELALERRRGRLCDTTRDRATAALQQRRALEDPFRGNVNRHRSIHLYPGGLRNTHG